MVRALRVTEFTCRLSNLTDFPVVPFCLSSTYHLRTSSRCFSSISHEHRGTSLSGAMMATKTNRVPKEEWDKHKSSILDLYCKRGLPLTQGSNAHNEHESVGWIMKHQHGFVARYESITSIWIVEVSIIDIHLVNPSTKLNLNVGVPLRTLNKANGCHFYQTTTDLSTRARRYGSSSLGRFRPEKRSLKPIVGT